MNRSIFSKCNLLTIKNNSIISFLQNIIILYKIHRSCI